jgi:SNF2 family DNA or RNA helicase
MSEIKVEYKPKVGDKVKVKGREDLGTVEVYRVSESFGIYQADVMYEDAAGRHLQSFPIERLESASDLWARINDNDYDQPLDFFLKQLAFQFPLQNKGGQLSNSRTDLLPHQILLTRDVISKKNRRLLVADEVGLGKTIELGMVIKELITREEANRILVITPAGLTKNWQSELRDAFRLNFEVLGVDFTDNAFSAWETHNRVIASIDTVKRPQRMEKILAGPRWDLIVFDESHHLTRTRYGKKIVPTLNYKLAEAIKNHTRDLIFLSATPHQGNAYQFWSLIQLLDDTLFDSEESMTEHKSFLSRVMIRRTKREVTDKNGIPLFMRREVHTNSFKLSISERTFYERLTDYLREGYNVAGVGGGATRTTSQQRAIGFVMTTFQKIMSSSIRAIKQALRRRLLVLLIRHQLELENQRRKSTSSSRLSDEILNLQDEMRKLASEILRIPDIPTKQTEIDAIIAQIKQRVSRNFIPEESTEWSLDNDEQGEEGMYADANIPDEISKVNDLINIVPEEVDRKFDTLTRAIDTIRNSNPNEKFVIFTQYVETLTFLKERLELIYGHDKVAVIKGGPLDDKIEAKDRFWDENGAQFLISTSAGGEGINLQIGHILFNYDLPWNPMALEQRIGRIHRYGQRETSQVFNLVAEDTIEEKIYEILNSKLTDIATSIGKIDAITQEPLEDFRAEILGYMGSSPNYLDWYKNALMDKDYKRTEKEIEEAMFNAMQSIDALKNLTMDMSSFNLQDYLNIEGKFSLEHMRTFCELAIIKLGGSILPRGEFYSIITPKILLTYPNVLPKYDLVAFNREAAMRKRQAELLGLGHPLIDAIIKYFQQVTVPGDVTAISKTSTETENYYVINSLFTIDTESGNQHKEMKTFKVMSNGDVQVLPDDWLLDKLESKSFGGGASGINKMNLLNLKSNYDVAVGALLTQIKSSVENAVSGRVKILGIINS